MSKAEWSNLTLEAGNLWDQNAAFWDNYMGDDGNNFHQLLVAPIVQKLLNIQPDETVLDIGCGNGNFSRRLVQLGAHVTAVDISETMIERARVRSAKYAAQITYRVVDAADKSQLLACGQGKFNAAVSNMALMDMAAIEPLLNSLVQILKPDGRFVFAVSHPCFLPPDMVKVVEEEDRDGKIITRYAVKVSHYITPVTHKGLAINGQPAPQYYFHRPLSMLFRACFEAGFVLDALEEPVFAESNKKVRPLSWSNFNEIPPVLVARLRKSP